MSKPDLAIPSGREASWCTPQSRVDVTRRGLDLWLAENAQCVRAVRVDPSVIPEARRADYHEVSNWLDQCGPRGDAVNGLILWGPPGTGKTVLATAALLSSAATGYRRSEFYWDRWNIASSFGLGFRTRDDYCPAFFYDCSELMRRLSPFEKVADGELTWFDHLERDISALVIDDIGMRELTDHRADILKSHVEWSAKGRILILTTNVPRADWTTHFGDRLADRFNEARRFHVLNVGGASMRRRA